MNKPLPRLCPSCGSVEFKIAEGAGPHWAQLKCAGCNRWLKWLSKAEAAYLKARIEGGEE